MEDAVTEQNAATVKAPQSWKLPRPVSNAQDQLANSVRGATGVYLVNAAV